MEINLKEKLRALRQQKSITQEALANHLGITPQSVGKWERGEGFPDITLLPKLSDILGVTEHELITASIDKKSREEKVQAENTFHENLRNFFFFGKQKESCNQSEAACL